VSDSNSSPRADAGLALFGMEPETGEPAAGLSDGRRRTMRQKALIDAGRHPLSAVTSRPLRLHPGAPDPDDRKAPGPRCGNCQFIEAWGAHGYLKCLRGDKQPFATHGAATDLRRWWPACEYWQGAADRNEAPS
jgi:hypothetical protein